MKDPMASTHLNSMHHCWIAYLRNALGGFTDENEGFRLRCCFKIFSQENL